MLPNTPINEKCSKKEMAHWLLRTRSHGADVPQRNRLISMAKQARCVETDF